MISANWPFSPKKFPFFYGWVVWGFGTMITIASVALSLMIIYVSYVDILSASLGGSVWLSFTLILSNTVDVEVISSTVPSKLLLRI